MSPQKTHKARSGKKDHYAAVLLEEVRAGCHFVIERLEWFENSIKAEMTRIKEELKTEIRRGNDLVIRHDGEIAALKKTA